MIPRPFSAVPFATLKGQVLTAVERRDDDALIFFTTGGDIYRMEHDQDCCETVTIEDVIGDLDSLVGSPILIAEEVSNSDAPPKDRWDESYTWTYYKLATIRGYVDIRWYGCSSGYYSESVTFAKVASA